MRDPPFQHLTDDELTVAHQAADGRYCEYLMAEFGVDRAAVVDWIIRSGELSVVNRAYCDEWRRRKPAMSDP